MTNYIMRLNIMRLKGLTLAGIACIYGIVHLVGNAGANTIQADYASYAAVEPIEELSTSESVPLPACRNSFIDMSTDKKYPIPHWVFSLPREADKALILAIAKTESRFKPHARSHRGAVGLMQLMPDTAHYMIKKHGALDVQLASMDDNFAKYLPRDPFDFTDPYVSLAIGYRYIQYLQNKRYIGDNIAYTLAAYNAGPGNLRKWQKRFGRTSQTHFTSRIPFKETRNYVRKVMRDYETYRTLLPKMEEDAVWVRADNC